MTVVDDSQEVESAAATDAETSGVAVAEADTSAESESPVAGGRE